MDRPFCFVTLFAALLTLAATTVAHAQRDPAALLEPSRFEVRNDTIKKAGVERVIGWWIVETQGEKIAYLRAGIPDRSDPQTARYAEWQQAQPPAR